MTASDDTAAERFRHVIGHFATGVTVLTALHEGRRFGTTASAITSLSLDPPMLVACMNLQSATGQAISEAGAFAVNVLGEEQDALAMHFARKGPDKFDGLQFATGVRGQPLLEGALAHLQCRVVDQAYGGTHVVYIAEIEDAEAREGAPLAYYRGRFGRLELAGQADAYARVHERVADRSLPIGRLLSVDAIAEELKLDVVAVAAALLRLSGEGLVHRDSTGAFAVNPVTPEIIEQAFRARAAVQLGAAVLTVGRLSPDELVQLRQLAQDAVPRTGPDGSVDLTAFFTTNAAFHGYAVQLAGSEPLAEAYRRFTVPGLMTRAVGHTIPLPAAVAATHEEIVGAYERGDLDGVCRAIVADAELAIEFQLRRLERAGGRA